MVGRRGLQIVLLLATACAVIACDPNFTYRRGSIQSTYTVTNFAYAAGGRDLRVVAIGNPYGGQEYTELEIAEAIAAAMQGRNWGPPTNFTATPGESARPNYKVVFAFNPVEPTTYNQVCTGNFETGETEGRIRIKAAFCQGSPQGGQRFLTTVFATIVPEAGPGSESFNRMFGGMTLDLFPPIYREDRGRCRGFMVICI